VTAPPDSFRVRCIHGNRDQLETGAEYVVAEVFQMLDRPVYGLHKHWPGQLFGAWRFERIDDQEGGHG